MRLLGGEHALYHTEQAQTLLSSAAEGEALPEEARAILIITRQPACLAQRRTGLPKKRCASFQLGFSVPALVALRK